VVLVHTVVLEVGEASGAFGEHRTRPDVASVSAGDFLREGNRAGLVYREALK